MLPMVARITGEDDRLQAAESAADMVLSAAFATPYVSWLARLGLAFMAVLRRDERAAEDLYVSLRSSPATFTFVSGPRVLGLLSHTMSNFEQAATHFEDALTFCRDAGYGPELAWTCHDYAETLVNRNGPGDSQNAAFLLGEALSISTQLCMVPLTERIAILKEQAESRSGRAPAYPDGLTQREVEVLRLVAAGKTDREISEELIIAVRTVTTHVRNILNKIGASNRTEAAAYANRTGLV